MSNGAERRAARRFTMTLSLTFRSISPAGSPEYTGQTRDVSHRGLYFTTEAQLEAGAQIEFVLTLPKEFTLSADVHIRCFGQVLRVEAHNSRRGIAARIERYEFLGAVPAHSGAAST